MVKAYAFQHVTLDLGYSEVNIHLRVAGKRVNALVQPRGVQLLDEDGGNFSFPITHSEAGVEYLGIPALADHYGCNSVVNGDNTWHCYTHDIFDVRDGGQ